MVLVIPLSGMGKRFIAAGYEQPKPLLLVDGKPIIAHVLDLFPGEDVVFICNSDHLEKTNMRSVLLDLVPRATIVEIAPHNKGPVFAIKQAYDSIPDSEEIMISYCDYAGDWDYAKFKQRVKETNADGAIPSYIGFHPHLLGSDFYGHIRWDENNWMIEIKEKESFTSNKMDEYGAVGAYWFRTGELMKHYFDIALREEMRTGDEFFCSLPFNTMVQDGKKILIVEMEKFCQWGTPQDLEEYESWSRAFAVLAGKQKGETQIPPEHVCAARATTAENHQKTFVYWQEFFAKKKWHPFSYER